VWQDKRAVIAQEIDGLGDQIHPAMRAGWLACIKNAYSEEGAAVGLSVGPGTLVVDDYDDVLLLLPPRRQISAMNTDPKRSLEL
jgi:hypothetical protein